MTAAAAINELPKDINQLAQLTIQAINQEGDAAIKVCRYIHGLANRPDVGTTGAVQILAQNGLKRSLSYVSRRLGIYEQLAVQWGISEERLAQFDMDVLYEVAKHVKANAKANPEELLEAVENGNLTRDETREMLLQSTNPTGPDGAPKGPTVYRPQFDEQMVLDVDITREKFAGVYGREFTRDAMLTGAMRLVRDLFERDPMVVAEAVAADYFAEPLTKAQIKAAERIKRDEEKKRLADEKAAAKAKAKEDKEKKKAEEKARRDAAKARAAKEKPKAAPKPKAPAKAAPKAKTPATKQVGIPKPSKKGKK